MIRKLIEARHVPLLNEDVALCQRVYYHVCAQQRIKERDQREELAAAIIHSYQQGIKNEASLRRLFL